MECAAMRKNGKWTVLGDDGYWIAYGQEDTCLEFYGSPKAQKVALTSWQKENAAHLHSLTVMKFPFA